MNVPLEITGSPLTDGVAEVQGRAPRSTKWHVYRRALSKTQGGPFPDKYCGVYWTVLPPHLSFGSQWWSSIDLPALSLTSAYAASLITFPGRKLPGHGTSY